MLEQVVWVFLVGLAALEQVFFIWWDLAVLTLLVSWERW